MALAQEGRRSGALPPPPPRAIIRVSGFAVSLPRAPGAGHAAPGRLGQESGPCADVARAK
eukprot:14747426-Alexandrium_andersonii.AAC.1